MCLEKYNFSYSLRISLSTVLFPAPIPPPMKRITGLLSLWATGAITSVHRLSSFVTSPIAFISSTNVLKTLATFRFLVTLSNLCSLCKRIYTIFYIKKEEMLKYPTTIPLLSFHTAKNNMQASWEQWMTTSVHSRIPTSHHLENWHH